MKPIDHIKSTNTVAVLSNLDNTARQNKLTLFGKYVSGSEDSRWSESMKPLLSDWELPCRRRTTEIVSQTLNPIGQHYPILSSFCAVEREENKEN